MDDSEIIGLYFSRDERAVEESQAKYGSYCMTVARNVLSVREDCEECVSDTWLAAWQRIPPEMPVCLRAFFGRITRNIAIDRYRRSHAAKRGGGEITLALDELGEILPSGGDAADGMIARETADAVNSFLRSIPERDCNIFLARYYFFHSVGTIAKSLGMTEAYVRVVLSRTRRKLAAYLKKENIL